MIIHLYALCWNEENMLPFFFEHYNKICDKIVIYDNGSTDNSINLIKANKNTELRTYSTDNMVRDDIYKQMKNTMWKESINAADWVFIVDIDEFILAKDLRTKLEKLTSEKYTAIQPYGYDMLERTFDFKSMNTPLVRQLRKGFSSPGYSKTSIISPKDIVETNYAEGMHTANLTGNVKLYHMEDIRLLHYTYIYLQTVIK
jgi:hypothetical protein